jgi:hypothetical protein
MFLHMESEAIHFEGAESRMVVAKSVVCVCVCVCPCACLCVSVGCGVSVYLWCGCRKWRNEVIGTKCQLDRGK